MISIKWLACLFMVALFVGCESKDQVVSDTEIRQLATRYRDEWVSHSKDEAVDKLRVGVIQSVQRTLNGWHITFVTATGHGQLGGLHDYFLHVYIDIAGRLVRVERGLDCIS